MIKWDMSLRFFSWVNQPFSVPKILYFPWLKEAKFNILNIEAYDKLEGETYC